MLEEVKEILRKYPKDRTNLVMILQDIQGVIGYLPKEGLELVSQSLKVPKSQVYAVAKFYRVLSLKPVGKNLSRVCMGTACHVRGAPLILDEMLRKLDIDEGETTPDGEFTVQTVGCVGACAIGPVVEINEKHYGHMDVAKVSKLLDGIKNKKEELC